jgi:hypothetical protein
MKLTIHSYQVPRIKNVWNCSAISPYTFLAFTPITVEERSLCHFSDIFRFVTCQFSRRRRMSEQFPVVFVEIPKITTAEQLSYCRISESVFPEICCKKPVLLHVLYDKCS